MNVIIFYPFTPLPEYGSSILEMCVMTDAAINAAYFEVENPN